MCVCVCCLCGVYCVCVHTCKYECKHNIFMCMCQMSACICDTCLFECIHTRVCGLDYFSVSVERLCVIQGTKLPILLHALCDSNI